MKVVGLYRELGKEVSQSLPSIYIDRDKMPMESVPLVLDYLASGVPVFDIMEASTDPFDNNKRMSGGPSLVSDGDWVWRNDLAYFVEKYRLGLSDEFIQQVRSCKTVAVDKHVEIIEKWQEALASYQAVESDS